MTKVYPIILTPVDTGFVVSIPDLNINTEGTDLAEAIFMARDAIGMWACFELDNNRSIPEPSKTVTKENDNGIISYVDIDIEAYRKKHEQRTVRRNITLPAWLDELVKANNINVSRITQEALKEVLNIE